MARVDTVYRRPKKRKIETVVISRQSPLSLRKNERRADKAIASKITQSQPRAQHAAFFYYKEFMTKQEKEISRPVTLYVEKIETKPTMTEYFEKRRVSVIDLEIDAVQAVQLIEYLRERNNQGQTGSIRIRFLGRMVHV